MSMQRIISLKKIENSPKKGANSPKKFFGGWQLCASATILIFLDLLTSFL